MNASSRVASGCPVAARSAEGVSRAITLPSLSEREAVTVGGVIHRVARNHDGRAQLGHPPEAFPEDGPDIGVESDRGFVENQQTRTVDECYCKIQLTRCRMPPLSLRIGSELRGPRSTREIASSTDWARDWRSDMPYILAKKSTFSRTDSSR